MVGCGDVVGWVVEWGWGRVVRWYGVEWSEGGEEVVG